MSEFTEAQSCYPTPDPTFKTDAVEAVENAPNSFFFRLTHSQFWKGILLVVICSLTLGSAWNRISDFEPQFILTVDSDTQEPASLYIARTDQTELDTVPSLLSYYKSQQTPTRMIFPLADPDTIRFIRFDPVLFTNELEVNIEILKLELKPAPFTPSLPVPFSALIPLSGVEKTLDKGSILLHIDAHVTDPQMQLILPGTFLDAIAQANRISKLRVYGLAATSILLALLLYFTLTLGKVRNPYENNQGLKNSNHSQI